MAGVRGALLEIRSRVARLEKKRRYFKYKFYAVVVLPIFVAVLAVKVAKTYLHLRLRQISGACPAPVQVEKEPVEREMIQPETVGSRVKLERAETGQ